MRLRIFYKIFLGFIILAGVNIQNFAQAEYEMLVSSRNTNSVKRFNGLTGEYIDDFVTPGSGGLNTTQDIKTGPEGNILVSGRGNTNILLYDRLTGEFIQPFTSGYSLDNPTKISFGPDGYLYVSQWGTTKNKVVRFNGITGVFIDEFTPSLNLELGHAWDKVGNLYVACYGSKDVRKFDTNGNLVGIFTETGHLQGPTNLWFDENGSLFVEDWVLGSVQQFSAMTGAFIKTFVSGLTNVEGYAFGPDGNLYLCDWTQNQIQRYTPNGNFIDVFATQGNMLAPNSILFRPVQTTSINDKTGSLPDGFHLYQNYPNPFNPITKISYQLAESGDVSLEVYDILGNEIATLVNEQQQPGVYEVEFSAKGGSAPDGNVYGLPSGIYFYKLTANDFINTRKMILMK